MTTERDRSRVRAEVMRSVRKDKSAPASDKKAKATAMWKRALIRPSDAPVIAGAEKSKVAMWRKAIRGEGA